MSHRAGEDADWSGGRDDAALRSVSGAAPCGRKESGDDRGGTRRGCGCDRSGGRGGAAIAESADQAAEQDVDQLRGHNGAAEHGARAGHKAFGWHRK